jgi:hypothetical protein
MSTSKLSKKAIAAIAAGVALFVLAGGAYAGYAVLDWFKDPKTIYLQAELKTLKQAVDSNVGERFEEWMQASEDGSRHGAVELSNLVLDIDGLDESQKNLFNVIGDGKLRVETHLDAESKQMLGKARLALQDKDVLSLEMIMDENKFGVLLPELHDKYWFLDLEQTEASAIGRDYLDRLPKKNISSAEILDAVRMTEEELKSVVTSYGKLVYEQLKPEQFAMNKDSVFREGEHEVGTRQITITFTEEQYKEFLTSIADRLADDATLQDLLYRRYDRATAMLLDAGYAVEKIDEKEFKREWEDTIDEFEKTIRDAELDEDARLVVEIDSKGMILSRAWTAEWTDGDDIEHRTEVEMRSWDGQIPGKGFSVTVRTEDNGEEAEFAFVYRNENEEERSVGEMTLEIEADNAGEDESVRLSVDYDINGGDQGEYRFELAFDVAGTEEVLGGEVSYKKGESAEGIATDYDIALDFDGLTEMAGFRGLSFKLRNETFPNAPFELPALDAGNSIDFANMTDADSTKFMNELTESFERYVRENRETFEPMMPDVYAMLTEFAEDEPNLMRPEAVKGDSVDLGSGIQLTRHTIETVDPEELIAYPVISGLAHQGIEAELNETFKALSVPYMTESYLAELESYGEAYMYNSDYEVKFQRGNILNIVFYNYMYTGGAHGMPEMISLIANLDTGATYQLSDLFTKDGTYYDVVNESILEQDVNGILASYGLFESVADNDGMYLQDDSIVVFFPPYQYASYADGFLEYALPYSALDAVIRKDGDLWKAIQQ